MNDLQKSETDLRKTLHLNPDGLTMGQILSMLPNHHESELRAAMWVLTANLEAEFTGDKLVPIEQYQNRRV